MFERGQGRFLGDADLTKRQRGLTAHLPVGIFQQNWHDDNVGVPGEPAVAGHQQQCRQRSFARFERHQLEVINEDRQRFAGVVVHLRECLHHRHTQNGVGRHDILEQRQ